MSWTRSFFEESFEVNDQKAEVLARSQDGQPLLVLKSQGQGRALLVGSFPGLAYHHFGNKNNQRFLAGLAAWLGIRPEPEIKASPAGSAVEARYLYGPDYRLLFVFNRSAEKVKSELLMSLPWKETSCKDLETDQVVTASQQGNRTSLDLELEPQQVRVFLVGKVGK